MINATYTLDMYIEEHPLASDTVEGDYPVLFVRLTTQPMPDTYLYMEDETHPFAFLADYYVPEDVSEKIRGGVYEQYIVDNTVTRAILDMLRDPEKMAEGAGCGTWDCMRACLIKALAIFWD